MSIKRFAVHACVGLAMLSGASALAADAKRPDKVSFYFAAHEDDWQLFMNPSAFEDVVKDAAKTVFVHITAGDDGARTGNKGRKHPFYLARENGAQLAIRFMADADAVPSEAVEQHVTLNGHSIYRVIYRNTVSYYLRVPDGNPLGTGYYEDGFQSLRLLAEGGNDVLGAIDGSTVYRGWADLVATLRALILTERGPARLIQVNAAELDPALNPRDHSDHLMTAKAAYEAVQAVPCVRRVSYVNYATMNMPANLKAQQRDRESSVYAVTLAGVLAMDHGTSWHHYDESFVGRNYFRVTEPAGRCDAPAATEVAAVRR